MDVSVLLFSERYFISHCVSNSNTFIIWVTEIEAEQRDSIMVIVKKGDNFVDQIWFAASTYGDWSGHNASWLSSLN